jgi:Bacterial PH domain
VSEFDFEPVPGLPGTLPKGETLLWQGKPDWWCLARHVFHLPLIAGYLGLMLAWWTAAALYDQQPLAEAVRGVMVMALLIAVCCGILAGLAYATARTTIHSITSERVVMRYGIALPMALNIPFAKVENASARVNRDGSGDIPLTLAEGEKIAYLMLWPHARPWRMSRPEPMLRGIPDAARAASILALALAAAASRPASRAKAATAAAPVAAPAAAKTVQAPRPAREAPSAAPAAIARLG